MQINIWLNGKATMTAKTLRNKRRTWLTAKKKSTSIDKEKNGSNERTQEPYLER